MDPGGFTICFFSIIWNQLLNYCRGFGVHLKVHLEHTSPITLTRCTQPHGECGRVVQWPSAPDWWCRRRRAFHSSCNWGGMPGLVGPFHLHPAVRWETQKIQELIMSLLGFCSVVWGWNQPPSAIFSITNIQLLAHPSPPTFFYSSTSIIPFYICSSHSLSQPCYYLSLPFLLFAHLH